MIMLRVNHVYICTLGSCVHSAHRISYIFFFFFFLHAYLSFARVKTMSRRRATRTSVFTYTRVTAWLNYLSFCSPILYTHARDMHVAIDATTTRSRKLNGDSRGSRTFKAESLLKSETCETFSFLEDLLRHERSRGEFICVFDWIHIYNVAQLCQNELQFLCRYNIDEIVDISPKKVVLLS